MDVRTNPNYRIASLLKKRVKPSLGVNFSPHLARIFHRSRAGIIPKKIRLIDIVEKKQEYISLPKLAHYKHFFLCIFNKLSKAKFKKEKQKSWMENGQGEL